MNLDTKSTVANAVYSSNEMAKLASSTQVKRFAEANTSFASEMKASSNKNNSDENIKESSETDSKDQISKSEKPDKKDSQKTESKHAEKTSKEDNLNGTQTLNGEVSLNEQGQNGSANQQQNGQNSYTPLSDQIQAYMNANGVDINFAGINCMNASTRSQISTMNISVDYSSIQMSDNDAKFFADLVSKTDMTAGNVAAEFQKNLQGGNIKMVESTAKASAALIEALKESAKTNQPFRIDFDKDVSVILQVDKAGKINANFIPGDKAVENYLRNNIEFLRQRFNEENISYGDINYSQSRRQKEEQQKRNNKENANE